MPTFDVFLARTYKVRMQAADALEAEQLAEEYVGPAADRSSASDRAKHGFEIKAIETLDNTAFDVIELDEG